MRRVTGAGPGSLNSNVLPSRMLESYQRDYRLPSGRDVRATVDILIAPLTDDPARRGWRFDVQGSWLPAPSTSTFALDHAADPDGLRAIADQLAEATFDAYARIVDAVDGLRVAAQSLGLA